MNVSEAVATRISIRAFLSDPVPAELVRDILTRASRAPSGGNLQPWRVVALAGAPLAALKQAALDNPAGEPTEYAVYPEPLWEPLRGRRRTCGEDLYATIGIDRADKAGRIGQLLKNGQMFGAPVGLFFLIDRRCGPPQWGDVGMLIQTVMLLAEEKGLGSCAQEYWARYPKTLKRILAHDDDHLVYSGLALGWPDRTAPINRLRTQRDAFDAWGEMKGF